MPAEFESIVPYEVHQVVASFHDAEQFENAVDAVEKAGIERAHISMLASHDAVTEKFAHRMRRSDEPFDDAAIPQAIYTDRRSVGTERAFSIGLPAYIGGAGAGLAVVATGGALAIAAVLAAAGAAAGAGIGALLANAVSRHHANYLEQQLAMGKLLLTVDAADQPQQTMLVELLTRLGGENVHLVSITRYWDPAAYSYGAAGSFGFSGLGPY